MLTIQKKCRIYGSSVGTLVAATIICGVDTIEALKFLTDTVLQVTCHYSGIFSLRYDLCQVIRKFLEIKIPNNIAEIASGKLFINVTIVPSMKPLLISEYKSKNDFIDVCFLII